MLIKKESYRKGIVLSTIFNIISKGLVFFNIVLIAYYFGTSIDVDIYFYSYNLILLLVTYSSSINTSILIPEAIRIRIRDGEKPSMNFVNYFLYLYLGITAFLTLVLFVNPAVAFAAVSKYPVAVLSEHARILFMVIPLLLLMTITTFISDILVSYRFFTMPMIITSVNAVVSMVCIIVFHDSLMIMSVLIGLMISFFLNVCILIWLMRKHLKWKFTRKVIRPEKRVFRNLAFTQAGTLAASLGTYAPIYFFSGGQAGVISALNYAQQIFYQPTALLTNQFTIVSRIKLNELFVNRRFDEINVNFLASLKFLVFLLTPISTFLFLFAGDIISVLFSRGSFDHESAELSAMFLKYLSLSLPLIAIYNIVANLFFASQRLKIISAFQIVLNIVMTILIFLGIQMFSEIGFPVAFLIMYILIVGGLYFLCRKTFPFINFGNGMIYFFKMIVINAALYFIVWFVLNHIPYNTPIMRLLIGGTVYAVVLLLLSYRFRLNQDFSQILDKISSALIPAKTKL